MNRGRGTASIVASPVLVGAVTTLVVIVAVFLAYNANHGLPFVPTYNLSLELPTGANLVPGDEIRIGGFRVGVVDNVRPGRAAVNGQEQNVAIIDMKLDKSAQPLPRDTQAVIRERSVLGLKYVQLTPGTSPKTYRAGDTIPLANVTGTVEFDDFLDTYDQQTRQNNEAALAGFGDALSGRGQSLNQAIEALNPFFQYLEPVMANLASPRTTLDQFFLQQGRTSAQVAPVAHTNAVVFTLMANTFAAISRCPVCLQQTIEKSPPTEDAGIRSFATQHPFLLDYTDLSRRLTPAAHELRFALPPLNSALRVGTPVSRAAATLNINTGHFFAALDNLAKQPDTLPALEQLRDTLAIAKPLINYVGPYQSVCNYFNYFLNGLGKHQAEATTVGTAEQVMSKSDPGPPGMGQPNGYASFAARPADVPSDQDPNGTNSKGNVIERAYLPPYSPAIDSRGNANCQIGQEGYVAGPLFPAGVSGRYPPHSSEPADNSPTGPGFDNNFENFDAGGSHVIAADNPMLAGPTFTGVPNLRSVP